MEDKPPNPRFVDSNVFICVLMNDPAHSKKALGILTRFEEGKETGWTSTLALSQVFSHLKKRGRSQAVDKFYDYLRGSPIGVAETTLEDITGACEIKEEQGHPWNMWDDLVLAAQMDRLGVTEIYSNDADFDKLRGLKRVF
jgi:predicted nucleic acid-binding protein